MGFVSRFLNGASQEIKVELNESWLLKFYQVKQLKENSTENSAEKNFMENSQLNELWNVSTKKKKCSNSEILSVPANCTNIFNPLSFLFLSFLFLLYKILFLNCVIFFEPVSELESYGTYCLNLPYSVKYLACI